MLTSQEIINAITRGINLAIIDKNNSGVSDIRALLMLLDYEDIGENVFSADEISLKNKISISAQLKRRVKAHEMAVVDIWEMMMWQAVYLLWIELYTGIITVRIIR